MAKKWKPRPLQPALDARLNVLASLVQEALRRDWSEKDFAASFYRERPDETGLLDVLILKNRLV